ncbi:hypothetical protein FB451DRAFT_1396331 [Mycena latifolia]|nr:hypothetical protein FB451DRAFT_1396331 [Mycena latifolia]
MKAVSSIAAFLDLPSELILACITPLHYKDLISCLNTRNRLLYNIIVNSILVQYGLEQHLAHLEENPSQTEDVVISDRLSDLRRREADWLNFTPRSRHTLTVDFVTTGIYDLTSEIYLLGDTPDQITSICTAIKYIFTSPEVDAAQWHRVDGGKPVIDFGTALEEHDLIAMVTYTQHPGNPHMRSVDIQLLKFSTGHPHPQAAQPTLHIQDVNILIGRPGISIEIVAENLAISMVYWDYEGRDMDTLHVYNWLTGQP